MTRPFRGEIELDVRDSTPDWEAFLPDKAPEGAPNVVSGGHSLEIEQTEAFLFSADETCDVGNEFGSPVTTDYGQREFSGEVEWVELELGLDDHDHLIKPEDRISLAMRIQ
jgi:hypothetical protein